MWSATQSNRSDQPCTQVRADGNSSRRLWRRDAGLWNIFHSARSPRFPPAQPFVRASVTKLLIATSAFSPCPTRSLNRSVLNSRHRPLTTSVTSSAVHGFIFFLRRLRQVRSRSCACQPCHSVSAILLSLFLPITHLLPPPLLSPHTYSSAQNVRREPGDPSVQARARR